MDTSTLWFHLSDSRFFTYLADSVKTDNDEDEDSKEKRNVNDYFGLRNFRLDLKTKFLRNCYWPHK